MRGQVARASGGEFSAAAFPVGAIALALSGVCACVLYMVYVYGVWCGCASVSMGVGAYPSEGEWVYECMCVVHGVCVLFMVWCVGVHQWV